MKSLINGRDKRHNKGKVEGHEKSNHYPQPHYDNLQFSEDVIRYEARKVKGR